MKGSFTWELQWQWKGTVHGWHFSRKLQKGEKVLNYTGPLSRSKAWQQVREMEVHSGRVGGSWHALT